MTHLVMFDVDGTLAESMSFDTGLFGDVVRSVLGAELDTTYRSYRHVTDAGILEELLEAHAPPTERDRLCAAVKERFLAGTRARFAGQTPPIREIAGARALFEALRARPDVRVAIATGAWVETARLKLGAIGIDPGTVGFATASDALERTAIMQLAERRALGNEAARRRTYFGDGAWDQRASAALGYEFVAIGRAVDHAPRFDDFREPAAVLECLGLPL